MNRNKEGEMESLRGRCLKDGATGTAWNRRRGTENEIF